MLKRIIPIIAVVAIAVIFVVRFVKSDSVKIKKSFSDIAEAVSKQPGEGNLAMGVKMIALGNMLDETVSMEIKYLPVETAISAEDLVSLATRSRNLFDEIRIDLIDIEIKSVEPERAKARCTAKVKVVSQYSSNFDEKRVCDAELIKKDGKWIFHSFKEDSIVKK